MCGAANWRVLIIWVQRAGAREGETSRGTPVAMVNESDGALSGARHGAAQGEHADQRTGRKALSHGRGGGRSGHEIEPSSRSADLHVLLVLLRGVRRTERRRTHSPSQRACHGSSHLPWPRLAVPK